MSESDNIKSERKAKKITKNFLDIIGYIFHCFKYREREKERGKALDKERKKSKKNNKNFLT